MKTGVIVGRFQIDYLHAGHLKLIDTVIALSDNIVMVIGSADKKFTDKNPLPYDVRISMLKDKVPHAVILALSDNVDDGAWSINLDKLLKDYKDVTLYHGRDGFGNHYKGNHPVVELKLNYPNYATARRKLIGEEALWNSAEFRRGIIYSQQNRYPIVYPTVDIAIIKLVAPFYSPGVQVPRNYEVLLGRKKDSKVWCFPGGFVDPKDKSILDAASRELSEELPGIDHHGLSYIGSYKVDDWRYRGTKDSIMTTLFYGYKMSGNDKAGDDLHETQWFTLKSGPPALLQDCHHILWEALYKTIYR